MITSHEMKAKGIRSHFQAIRNNSSHNKLEPFGGRGGGGDGRNTKHVSDNSIGPSFLHFNVNMMANLQA